MIFTLLILIAFFAFRYTKKRLNGIIPKFSKIELYSRRWLAWFGVNQFISFKEFSILQNIFGGLERVKLYTYLDR